jgi:hypothetical protein
MSKYGALIKEARKQDHKRAKNQEAGQIAHPEEEVNLSIKVARSLRQHWAAESKRQGTTLKAAITESLNAKFGKPE